MTERQDWAHSTLTRLRGRCMGCGKAFPLLDVHEIERRSQAPTRWEHTCNYLLLCRTCHAGPFATMPHAQQLAYKLYWDAEHFNLDAWLRLKDQWLRAPLRVTYAEVIEYLEELRERFG